METIRKVRQAHLRDGKGIREIATEFNLSRNTVRSIIRSGVTNQKYERSVQPRPKLGSFVERLSEWLKEDSNKPVKHRRRAQILFEQLQREGYAGGYDAVRRYVGTWKKDAGTALVNAFLPLEWDPGDAFQFDWSYEKVELGGVPVSLARAGLLVEETRHRVQTSIDVQGAIKALGKPVIIAGDFNMPVESAIYRQVWKGYSNAFSRVAGPNVPVFAAYL